ncbi:S-adenosyl-L-methionine-dependent methyltransferase [Ramaria rubella]|nr:S-adenosyl-L-methionine-dependent methyltransferase [Ramaria rubella]
MSLPQSAADIAQLSSLVDLISAAVKVVESEYASVGQRVPYLNSTAPGPFDTPEEVSVNLAKAVQTIEAACAQLSFTVASPGHVVTNKAYGFEEPACMLVVSNAKIADLLLNKPEGIHVDELAKKSSLDAGKLGRILRLLATKHCFSEVRPNVFANNRLSIKLLSTDPVSGLIGHMTDEAQKSAAYLPDTIADPKSGPSSLPQDAPFQRAHGCSFFDYFGTPEGKKRTDRFAQAMVGWGEVTGKAMLPKVYPWGKLPQGTVVCDVGGGNGHATLALAKVFSQLKITVQDLPAVIDQGKAHWGKEFPEAVQNQRVEFVSMDFFKEAPVANCDFYYLRHVLHDWPLSECLKILSNVRKSMKPSSKLLIHEFVLQHIVRDPTQATTLDQAPEPLLPNYGMGKVRLYQQDINMMNLLNSKERTLQEFIDMANQTGFKFVKLWDSGEAGVVEFSPA